MFLNKEEDKKSFGVMFHHFHDENKHVRCQGSIDATKLEAIINWLNEKYVLLSAKDYLKRVEENTLEPHMKCLTFDDGLRCQYDVALPVLNRHKLTAFWFVYSSPFVNDAETDRLEIYHNFRFSMFKDIDDFYGSFFDMLKRTKWYELLEIDREIREFSIQKYRPDCSFYTMEDRLFRYLRNCVLKEHYHSLMDEMMMAYKYDIDNAKKSLWIEAESINSLAKSGHIIGLHTHTHHTNLTSLSYEMQKKEWVKNKEIIENMTNKEVVTASYPCGVFNEETIRIMKENKIILAFADNMLDDNSYGNLSMNRIDNTYL